MYENTLKKNLGWCLGQGKHLITALYSLASSWINIPILKLINITIWKILSPFPVGIIWILISCLWGWGREAIASPLLPISIYMSGCYVDETFALVATGGMRRITRTARHFIFLFLSMARMLASSAPGLSCPPELKSLNKYAKCLCSGEWHMLALFVLWTKRELPGQWWKGTTERLPMLAGDFFFISPKWWVQLRCEDFSKYIFVPC